MTPAGQAQNLRFRKAPGSENVVLTPTAVTLAAVTLAAVTPATLAVVTAVILGAMVLAAVTSLPWLWLP